jgi:hypothetical protein
MSELTDRAWRLLSNIVSLALSALVVLLLLGAIFSENIRSNFYHIYEFTTNSGIVGWYVLTVLCYTFLVEIMYLFLALYNAGGVNRHLPTKLLSMKQARSIFETRMSRLIYIIFPIAIFLYSQFFFT